MFKSILVGLSDHEHSLSAVQQAICLARKENAKALGVYVVDEETLVPPIGAEGVFPQHYRAEMEPGLQAVGRRRLNEFATYCADAGVAADTRLLIGSVTRSICQLARTVDLIVLSRIEKNMHRGLLMNCCLLENVLRWASRPVMVASPQSREIRQILVAYDGREGASKALATAARFAAGWGLPLTVVTVAERKVGPEDLLEAQSYLGPYGLDVRPLLLEGNPGDEILRAAAKQDADLIVMGTYCHGRAQQLIFGGTLWQVLKKADRPVLICC